MVLRLHFFKSRISIINCFINSVELIFKIMQTLKSGHTWKEISEEDNKRMTRLFFLFNNAKFGRVYPGGWFYPFSFPDVLNKTYEIEVRPTDVYVVALPKSGITWTLELTWTLIHNANLENIEARRALDIRTPHIEIDMLLRAPNAPKLTEESETVKYVKEKAPDKLDMDFMGMSLCEAVTYEPRLFKSHMPISFLQKKIRDECKIIYVVRDPRDVVVSGYDHWQRWFHNYKGTLDEFIDNFVNAELINHPYWSHIKEAYDMRNLPNVLLIYFEDMKADPVKQIARITEFLGLERTSQQIKNVAEYTTFENMKKLTDEGKVSRPYSDGGRFELNDAEKQGFFRKGKSGSWKEELNEEQKEKFLSWMKKELEAFPDDFKYKKNF